MFSRIPVLKWVSQLSIDHVQLGDKHLRGVLLAEAMNLSEVLHMFIKATV